MGQKSKITDIDIIGPWGREFDSRPVRYQGRTLGKLFTPTCLCRCTWSCGLCRLVWLSCYGSILIEGHCKQP